MRMLLFVTISLLVVFTLQGQTTVGEIPTPNGYVRTTTEETSFTSYLRKLPLLPKGSKVHLYNGKIKANQAPTFAVVDMEIGNRDLQQCADATIRLRAEYLWKQKRYTDIKFNFTNGFTADYVQWAEGNRIKVEGNKVNSYAATSRDYSYPTFRKYLDRVFMYAGTASLAKELQVIPYPSIQPGDVFIQGGFPGHAVIVVDMAIHPETLKKVFLLAQSYMPAQQIHILTNLRQRQLSPWYELDNSEQEKIYTPEWTFEKKDIKRFK